MCVCVLEEKIQPELWPLRKPCGSGGSESVLEQSLSLTPLIIIFILN